ncbi:MAG: hypothetical protein HYW34_01030 [Candidatus Brennerbacteria bacterium]|nr:hypothetical protein [Candidatus Brennerbacteria bacterium]
MAQTTIQNLKKELQTIKKDVALLKIMLTQRIKYSEGEYHPEFIRKISETAKEQPLYVYKKGEFLKQIS